MPVESELKNLIWEMKTVRKKKGDIEDQEGSLWTRFFEISDDLSGEGQSYRFVDPKLKLFMAREMHNMSPKINVAALQAELTEDEWKKVTRQERVLDMDKLEAALATGSIKKDVVEQCMEYPASVPHRKFGNATKNDLESLRELGGVRVE